MKPASRDALLTAIVKARGWIDDIRLGRIASFTEISKREGQGERHIRLLPPLAFVSPRIITAPADLTVTGLAKALPYSWAEPRRAASFTTHAMSLCVISPLGHDAVVEEAWRRDSLIGREAGEDERRIGVDVALGHALRCVPQQPGNCELREPELGRHARRRLGRFGAGGGVHRRADPQPVSWSRALWIIYGCVRASFDEFGRPAPEKSCSQSARRESNQSGARELRGGAIVIRSRRWRRTQSPARSAASSRKLFLDGKFTLSFDIQMMEESCTEPSLASSFHSAVTIAAIRRRRSANLVNKQPDPGRGDDS